MNYKYIILVFGNEVISKQLLITKDMYYRNRGD